MGSVLPPREERAPAPLPVERSLEEALGRLTLWFQPIVTLSNGVLSGYEALVRWRGSDGTMASPADFLPVAEATGLIVDIDRSVMEQAARALGRLPASQTVAPCSTLTLSVQASGSAPMIYQWLQHLILQPDLLHPMPQRQQP